MEDREIVKLYLARSDLAISETEREYGTYCRSIAYNILQNREDVEECVNDAWLRAWNAIPPAQPDQLQPFLGKITRNLALNRWEKEHAQKRGAGGLPLILDELTECVSDGASADRMPDALLLREVLNRFLRSLAPQTRRIFLRRYWYMCSIREIAEESGSSESKVAVTLFRTRNKLKKVLEKEGIPL